ncbi:MAG: hypothetical protein D6728_00505 [Cyanobacteria bacterium J055]|nr:MAG: hypothetical protein D6728_00505 [Cyanobacteria bacterium J055]
MTKKNAGVQDFRRILNPGQTEVLATESEKCGLGVSPSGAIFQDRKQGFQAPTEPCSVASVRQGVANPLP